jgi:hypothetical protein
MIDNGFSHQRRRLSTTFSLEKQKHDDDSYSREKAH